MKTVFLFGFLSILFLSCSEEPSKTLAVTTAKENLIGEWDNFQQYWLEHTAEEKHKTHTDDKHRHLSLEIIQDSTAMLQLEIREGRNGKQLVSKIALDPKGNEMERFKQQGDTLYVEGLEHFKNKDPYTFIRKRQFSGWIEYPLKQYQDSIYRKGGLRIHDQGGMAEIDIEGVQYTVELTQLLFAHKLPIMKLAIYDMPMDSVQINSRSISYTWLNPEARRTGINLRKVITGWTLIEPGYQNQNTWRKEE